MTNPNPNDVPGLGGAGAGPGRDLDRLVSEKLGWHYEPRFDGDVCGYMVKGNKRVIYEEWEAWSTDWNAAGQLLEYLKSIKLRLSLRLTDSFTWNFLIIIDSVTYFVKEADTAPHAICLAFLALPDEVVKESGEK